MFFFNPIQLLNGPANLFLLPKLTANDLLQRWIVHEVILADPFNDLLSIICKAVILQRYPPAAVVSSICCMRCFSRCSRAADNC